MQPILIAPFKTGLDTDISSYLAPIDSFRELNNFHVHHGYIEKRSGYRIFGYMVHNPSTTITNITQSNPAVVTAPGHGLPNGQTILIKGVSGMTEVNGLLFTVANAALNTFELSGINSTGYTAYAGGGRVDLVPGNRIMGIYRYFNADGSKATLVFDTKRAAIYNGTSDRFDPLDAADIFGSGVYDYIWAENWQHSNSTNRLYFTNGLSYDGVSLNGIRYYDPNVSTTATTLLTPTLGGTKTLYGGKLIFAIKQRLVVLNTFEFDSGTGLSTNFPQRARWCQAQGPSNWNDTTPGGGGYVDAPTGEQIISARALQDIIIVFFTNSVWALRPVSDPALPFRWDKINDFRACDGKMATVQYDRYVVAFGVRGITATDGVETKRIDNRITDFTYDDINVDEFQKVYCARNYDNERMLTLYASLESTENDSALILDDDSLAFSKYEIPMNCLGYGNLTIDYSLDDFTVANNLDLNLSQFNDETLQSYYWQENQEIFLGGDINGIVYILQTDNTDNGTAIGCDLFTNAWNPYVSEGREARLVKLDIYTETDKNTQITVEFYKDTATSPEKTTTIDLLPPLGFIADISNITQSNPAVVTAKNNGLSTGNQIYIYGVQGMTSIDGAYTITVIDQNTFSLDGIDSTAFSAYTTGGQVVQYEYYRTKVWKSVYAGTIGFQHRVRILNEGVNQPLRIEGFQPHFKPIGKRINN